MDAAKAAGMDEIEESQVWCNVQRQTMIADPAAHGDADRRDLAPLAPHSGPSGHRPPLHPVGLEHADQGPFEPAQEAVQVPAAPAEIHDRVGHELARAVPGEVAAARALAPPDPGPSQ